MDDKKNDGFFAKLGIASKAILDNFTESRTLALEKARMDVQDEKLARKTLYLPTQEYFQGINYKEKASRIGFQTLRIMGYRDSVINAIVQTRLNQVANFSRPQKTKYQPGFVVRMKNRKANATKEDENKIKFLETFFLNCGFNEGRPRTENITFEEFLRRILKDRLIYDQVAVELIRTKGGNLHHFMPVDSSTIRLAAPKDFQDNTTKVRIPHLVEGQTVDNKPTEADKGLIVPDYVQVIEGRIVKALTANDLVLRFGNPTNDIYTNGYSVGELELLTNTVTSHMHAEQYNRLFFTQGHVTKGILHFKSKLPQAKLEAFKQAWYAQATGNSNSWRTPIVAMDDEVKWISLAQNNRDMEFHSWLNYLIKIACAIYQISPAEIGFDISREVDSSPSFFEANNEYRIKHSKDKGLGPLLRFIEDLINEDIMPLLDPNYEFQFAGFDIDTEKEEVERNSKEGKAFKTIDDLRAEHDLPPKGVEQGGHLILDASYINWMSQFGEYEMQKNAEQQMAMMVMQQPTDEESSTDQAQTDINNEEDAAQKSLLRKSKVKPPKLLKVQYWRSDE